MNYNWLFSRIALFFATYFGIYAYSVIGGVAFTPYVAMLAIYAFCLLLVDGVLLFLHSRMKEALAKKPKEGITKIALYGVGDLVILFTVAQILTFNGFMSLTGWTYGTLILSALSLPLILWANTLKGSGLTKS